jgi:CRISPR/Cas system-associated exonuclease Cas4 (RecB family)
MAQEAIPARRAFSHSGIREYLSCPKKYFFGHILRLQGITLPGASLGTLVHQTLSAFHRENPNLDVLPPGKAGVRLHAILDQEMQAMQAELGPQLLNESLRRLAVKLLDDYLDYLALPSWEGRQVLETEKPFSFRYGKYIIRGRIDRIDQLQDGTFELVDYKTSAYDNAAAKAIKKQFLNFDDSDDYQPADFQLPIYYLAMEAEGKKVTRLSYYQIGSQNRRVFEINPENTDRSQERAFEITGGDLEVVKQLLHDTLDAMASGQYPACPKTPQECKRCLYKWICTAEIENDESETEAGEEA